MLPATARATSVVSYSGSETGAASRAYVWPVAVSLTAHSALTGAYIPNQVRYSNVCAVRDEEADALQTVSNSARAVGGLLLRERWCGLSVSRMVIP